MITIVAIVHPGAKRNLIKVEQDLFHNEVYHVYTSAKPVDGEANKAVLELLAGFFNIKKYQIRLISGEASKYKKFKVVK